MIEFTPPTDIDLVAGPSVRTIPLRVKIAREFTAQTRVGVNMLDSATLKVHSTPDGMLAVGLERLANWADLQQGDILSLVDLVGKLAFDAGEAIEGLMHVETTLYDARSNRMFILNVPPDLLIKLDKPLRAAQELCQTFALTNALAAVRRLIRNVDRAGEKPLRLAHVIEDLYQARLRILDELKTVASFTLIRPTLTIIGRRMKSYRLMF